jgi:integrase
VATLTETFVKKATLPERSNAVHYDDEVKGFGLRVTAGGNKSFVLNYHIAGRERRMTIGGHPTWSAAAARDEAKKLRRLIDQGTDPLEERQSRHRAPTVQKLWEEYERRHLPSLSPRGQVDQRAMWRDFILPAFKNDKVADLRSAAIDALHASISQTKPVRANRVLEVLRKALNLAIRWGWIERNVADSFSRNREEPRERFLNPDEYQLVLSKLETMPSQKAANAIRLLALTGARRGEVLNMEWTDLDLAHGLWTIPAEKNKARKKKRLPLSVAANALLLDMRGEVAVGKYVFQTSEGTAMPDLKRPWDWLRRETGMTELRIHDLRHSFASMLISQGETLEVIGKLLGHAQYQTTLRYAHLADDPLRSAVEKIPTKG